MKNQNSIKAMFERFIGYLFIVGLVGAVIYLTLPEPATKFFNSVGLYLGPVVILALLYLAYKKTPHNPEK